MMMYSKISTHANNYPVFTIFFFYLFFFSISMDFHDSRVSCSHMRFVPITTNMRHKHSPRVDLWYITTKIILSNWKKSNCKDIHFFRCDYAHKIGLCVHLRASMGYYHIKCPSESNIKSETILIFIIFLSPLSANSIEMAFQFYLRLFINMYVYDDFHPTWDEWYLWGWRAAAGFSSSLESKASNPLIKLRLMSFRQP